jgi:uncharacterized metal-binding protein
MAVGRVHARDTQLIAFVGAIIVSPDLDQESISYVEWRIVRYTLGLGFLWLLYWWPYSRLIPHRHISHWPILGTLTRILYLAPAWYGGWLLGVRPASWVVWAALGLTASDLVHWLRDKL